MNSAKAESCPTKKQLQFAKDQATFLSSEINSKHLAVKHLGLSDEFEIMGKLAELSEVNQGLKMYTLESRPALEALEYTEAESEARFKEWHKCASLICSNKHMGLPNDPELSKRFAELSAS